MYPIKTVLISQHIRSSSILRWVNLLISIWQLITPPIFLIYSIIFQDNSHLHLDLSQDNKTDMISEFKEKWKGKFPQFLSLTLRNQTDKLLKEVCKIIDNEQIEYNTEVDLINSIPKVLWFKFEYKCQIKNKFNIWGNQCAIHLLLVFVTF